MGHQWRFNDVESYMHWLNMSDRRDTNYFGDSVDALVIARLFNVNIAMIGARDNPTS